MFLLVPAALAAVMLLSFVDRESGLLTWFEFRAELAESRQRIAVLTAETEALRAEVSALESDPFALERAIREDLELARPGETVVRFGAGEGDRTPGS